jgi:hypothetical protein
VGGHMGESRDIFYRLRTEEEEVIEVIHWICRGSMIEDIVEVKGYEYRTVIRWLKRAYEHMKEVEEYLVRELKLSEVQIDEFWSYVKKKLRM